MTREPQQAFLATLFDLSFNRFVVVRVVRVLYVAAILGAIVTAGAMAWSGFLGFVGAHAEVGAMLEVDAPALEVKGAELRRAIAVATMAGAPFVAVFMVLASRVLCELVVVVFRIAELLARD